MVLTGWHSGPSLLVLRTMRSAVIYEGDVKPLVVVVNSALVSYIQAVGQKTVLSEVVNAYSSQH